MSEAKQRCQLDGCSRAASTLCFCCRKTVCTRHFTEHIEAVKAQIDPLANEINTMVEKIQGLTIEQITESSFAGLHQWRTDMHQLIDDIFLAKTKEIEDMIEINKNKFDEHKNQQSENIMKMQDDVRQLVEDGDATFEQIQLLKNQLAGVETNLVSFQQDFLSVSTRIFAQGLVTVSSKFNKPPVFQSLMSNQPPPPNLQFNLLNVATPAQISAAAQNQRAAHHVHVVATPTQQSVGFSFGSCSGVQNKPPVHSSTSDFGGFAAAPAILPFGSGGFVGAPAFPSPSFGGFGANPSNSPSTSGTLFTPSAARANNNPSIVSNVTPFPSNIKGKK